MTEANPKLEQLQTRFKNSWIGIIVLTLIAVVTVLAQFGDSAKKLIEWIRPAPTASLRAIVPLIQPLDGFSDKVVRGESETIYPVGATFAFDLVHDGVVEDVITLAAVDVRVDDFQPAAACPFTLTGDRLFGHGEPPLRVFTVYMANGNVSSFQLKPARNEPMRRGRGNNLLATEGERTPLKLEKGDKTEAMQVTFILDDAAKYKIGLSIRYGTRDGQKVATIPAVTICKPRKDAS